jgi:hypothetical protein
VIDEFVLRTVRSTNERESASPGPDDKFTPAEKEEERFRWLELGLVSRLANVEKTATGLIRFYADDQVYDITSLTRFIDSARYRLADYGRISPERLRVEFGGYRPSVQVEFWIVRAGATGPGMRPFERCEQAEG